VWLLDEFDQDFILEPRVDDHLVIRLKNHLTAGYTWSVEESVSEGFEIQPILVDKPATSPFIAGGMHHQDYLVSPKDVSDISSILLSELKAWDKASPALDKYESKACFEDLANGLSPVAKKAVLQGT